MLRRFIYRYFMFVPGMLSALAVIVECPAIALPNLKASNVPDPNLFQPAIVNQSPNSIADYLLGPGDQIEITVFGYDEYAGERTILPDGTISLPVIGRVMASGQTLDQLTQNLTTRLNPLLVEPVVDVKLSRLRPILVTVAGEVHRPGSIQLQGVTPTVANSSGTSPYAPTVSEAITQAGGITRSADIRGITLKRLNAQGQTETITLNLWDTIQSEKGLRDPLLRDGDSIFVPTATSLTTADQQLIARSSYAPKTVRVRVVGEVKKPGEIEITPESSISSAVAIAGGPTDKADLKKVSFIRLNDNGTIEKKELDLNNLTASLQIQESDVVIVPKKRSSSVIDTAASIFTPLGAIGNLLFLLFR
jgi:polysaccharide export outer membrane protein